MQEKPARHHRNQVIKAAKAVKYHYLCGFPSKNSQIDFNHEEINEKPN